MQDINKLLNDIRLNKDKLKNKIKLRDYLYDKKYEFLSSGAFAYCFSHKDINYVIKIYAIEDDVPYYNYFHTIKQLKNPYTPKIYGSIEINNLHIVILEKLEEIEKIPRPEREELFLKHFNIDYNKKYNCLHYILGIDFKTELPSLKRLFGILHTLCNLYDCFLDNHGDNILYRKIKDKYFPVFIDPIYNWKKGF